MSWRRRIRFTVDRLSWLSGTLRCMERRMRGGVTILTYHRVLDHRACDAYPLPSLVMPIEDFERQVQWLATRYELTTVSTALVNSAAPRRPIVCLTFDDGYTDGIETVAPILEAVEAKGTFFVTTDPVLTGRRLWFDRAAALFYNLSPETRRRVMDAPDIPDLSDWMAMFKRLDQMTRNALIDSLDEASSPIGPVDAAHRHLSAGEIGELAERGHEIGSHTCTHPILTDLDDANLANEIEDARSVLRSLSGQAVVGFCYPNGDHDNRVTAAVKRAGHGYACTTISGFNRAGADAYRLRRVDLTRRAVSAGNGGYDPLAFRAEVSGIHELWR